MHVFIVSDKEFKNKTRARENGAFTANFLSTLDWRNFEHAPITGHFGFVEIT